MALRRPFRATAGIALRSSPTPNAVSLGSPLPMRWTWASIRPGRGVPPGKSRTGSPSRATVPRPRWTTAMRSPSIAISAGPGASPVPPNRRGVRMIRRMTRSSRRRSAIAIAASGGARGWPHVAGMRRRYDVGATGALGGKWVRPACEPPCTPKVVPVIQVACSEQRKTTASAISSGLPVRRRGMPASRAAT